MGILTKKYIKQFTLGIEHGCFMWKVQLLDDEIYQIKYRIEEHLTQAGNKSKRKIYFIKKDEQDLIFDEEVKKWFYAFRIPYLRDGI